MLTKYDEFLCHQIVSTFDSVDTSAREWTERLWFCAHDTVGQMMMVAGFGLYPNRNIMDAFACIVDGKTQHNIRASRELRPRIDDVAVGPFNYSVEEPFRTLRWGLGENAHNLSYDLRFHSTMTAHEEEPQVGKFRGRVEENVLRYFQVGRPSGWMKVGGKTITIDQKTWRCERDHSWGIRRGGGVPETGVQPGEIPEGYLYHMATVQFDTWGCTYHTRETWEEVSKHFSGAVFYGIESGKEEVPIQKAHHNFTFRKDIRQIAGGESTIKLADGTEKTLTFKPINVCYLKPGGYFGHAGFVHGLWMGPVYLDALTVDTSDPRTLSEIAFLDDVICEVQCGQEKGFGIVEMVIVGKYPRYGYHGY